MQSRYLPVALMYYEGVGRLVDAGVSLPGLRHAAILRGSRSRLSGPAGARTDRAALVQERDEGDRRAMREAIVAALEAGEIASASRSPATRRSAPR